MLPFPINFITSDVEGTAAAEPTKIQIEFSESETISIEEVQVDPKSNQPYPIIKLPQPLQLNQRRMKMAMKILHRLVHQKADLMKTPMKNLTKENVLLQNVAKNEHVEVGVVAF